MVWTAAQGEEQCADERWAGGKAASLQRLTALGVTVPRFFVVGSPAHRALGAGELPSAFVDEVVRQLATLGPDGIAVAVRSSAIGEDSADSSFAGLYHTSLGVRGLEAVLNAIRECWASYDGATATAYREERHEPESGAMAVAVQVMVDADWSGVCFTANPVTQALSEGLINAARGLGEALVSGSVNPEEISVDAREGAILGRKDSDGAGLPAELVQRAWETSSRIAEAFGFPQDVEWAAQGGEIHILQSRPITTIADVFYSRLIEPWREAPDARPDDPARIWSRAYADEIWTPPVSPLFYNIQNLTSSFTSYWRWHHDKSALPPDVFKYYKASAYLDVNVLKRMYEYHPRFSRISGILNFFPERMQRAVQQAPFRSWGRLRRTLHFELRQRELRSLAHNYKALAAQWPPFIAETDAWFDKDLDALSLDELRAHQAEVGQTMGRVSPPCGFAVAYHAHDLTFILTGLLERWCGNGDELYARVTSGLDDSETVRESQSIWDIANDLRTAGLAGRARSSSSWAAFAGELAGSADGKLIMSRLEEFWRNHRHRGGSYKDLVYPRWGDDIEMLWAVVTGYLQSETPRPIEENRRNAAGRREAQREILRGLHGPLAPGRRRVLRWLFRYNEIYMAERDNHRFYFDRCWYELRRIYLSIGRRLTGRGVFATADDVFYLGAAEVEGALAGSLGADDVRRRVEVRRAEWQHTLRVQAPKFLKGYAPYSETALSHDGVINGIGASPGIARGRARVVFEVTELPQVRDGEILVTRQTDPGWTTVFSRIGGLVLETGGVLAHGTSLCREYGVPCVTAVEQATVRIPDGAQVEIVGNEGVVRLLGQKEAPNDARAVSAN